MSKIDVSELVTRARGDRTKRKYAEESGVNVAIISRIESGDYMPGKRVLEKLTSIEAKPQGGVAYNDLIEAANDNRQYQKGLAAGMLSMPFGVFGLPILAALFSGETMIKADKLLMDKEESVHEKRGNAKNDTYTLNEVKDLATGMERYKATATGIIFSNLVEQGIMCRPGKQENTDFPMNYTDTLILVEDNEIEQWILSCFTLNEENRNMEAFIKPFATRFIDKLLHTKPDPKKKASFVVDDDELYEELLALRGNNSYRGNLSVIQFDAKKVKIIKEQYISYYNLDDIVDKLLVVKAY